MEVQKWSFTAQRHASAQLPPAVDQEDMELKRGPWTVDEDLILVDYIAKHGEGRWNSLARCAGLKRTGKSCRLRWLNYLRPDVRRGNLTAEEQLLILELHSRWGNRWSKIAQYLPGRTDNEIKNYWRTRVQKHAKQLNCDVGSNKFKDAMRYLWMPRLLERIRAAAPCSRSSGAGAAALSSASSVDHKLVPTVFSSATTPPHSPLESSDVDDPPAAGSWMISNAVNASSAGTLVLSDHDQALPRDDAAWAESLLDCSSTVPQFWEDDQSATMDQLQQQCGLDDEWGSGDMFVDNFWSLEDIWSIEDEGML